MIEIRELIIKATVNESGQLKDSAVPIQNSAAKIAEQIENIIRRTKER